MIKAARDRDRSLAHASRNEDGDIEMADDMEDDAGSEEAEDDADDDPSGSRVIVIHPGSQNLRIGLASDALPKTIPMVIARRWPECECDEEGVEPRPKRLKTMDDDEPQDSEELFGKEVRRVQLQKNSRVADTSTVSSRSSIPRWPAN